MAAVATLSGIELTIALLIGESDFADGVSREGHAKVGVLTASVLAAIAGSVALRLRARVHRVHRHLDQTRSVHGD